MADILREGSRTADFIVSEAANIYRSRGTYTIAGGAEGIPAGTVCSVADGTATPVAVDGDAAAILQEAVPAGETVDRTFTARDSEVNGAHLTYPDGVTDAQRSTLNAALAERGIIIR